MQRCNMRRRRAAASSDVCGLYSIKAGWAVTPAPAVAVLKEKPKAELIC